jgi:hypothetical protein
MATYQGTLRTDPDQGCAYLNIPGQGEIPMILDESGGEPCSPENFGGAYGYFAGMHEDGSVIAVDGAIEPCASGGTAALHVADVH